jgi:hypothetical protein
MNELLLKLTPEEITIFFKEIECVLRRGYSLGYVDGISHTQGRPQSSSSEYAIKNHIEQIKELYNL